MKIELSSEDATGALKKVAPNTYFKVSGAFAVLGILAWLAQK